MPNIRNQSFCTRSMKIRVIPVYGVVLRFKIYARSLTLKVQKHRFSSTTSSQPSKMFLCVWFHIQQIVELDSLLSHSERQYLYQARGKYTCIHYTVTVAWGTTVPALQF